MRDDPEALKQRVAMLEKDLAVLKQQGYPYRGVRKRSRQTLWGLPLYDIALGPDPERGEMRGHARGLIAIGDIATGGLAIGGVARGLIATGGLALGLLFGFGGVATGLLAFGGLAIGGIAMGGAAAGGIAIGGGAAGYYAAGGSAWGEYVISGLRQDPEAVQFFRDGLSWLPGMVKI